MVVDLPYLPSVMHPHHTKSKGATPGAGSEIIAERRLPNQATAASHYQIEISRKRSSLTERGKKAPLASKHTRPLKDTPSLQ